MPARRQSVERRARWRCEYCQAPQKVCGYRFHIERSVPQSLGGTTERSNLALACGPCHLAKSTRTWAIDPVTGMRALLFHPRTDRWEDQFTRAVDSCAIAGRTPVGRATVRALDMNAALRREARAYWFELGLLA